MDRKFFNLFLTLIIVMRCIKNWLKNAYLSLKFFLKIGIIDMKLNKNLIVNQFPGGEI